MKHELYLSNIFTAKGAHSTFGGGEVLRLPGLDGCGLIVQIVLISVLSELQRDVFL